jgi:hypothetical protein
MSRIIRWTPERRGDDRVLWISVSKLDAAWRRDRGNYLATGGGEVDGIHFRYKRFGIWLYHAQVKIWMPHIGADGRCVSFTDGRHRFTWLRDRGVVALPVSVAPCEFFSMARRYGTRTRVCRLPARAFGRFVTRVRPARVERRPKQGFDLTAWRWPSASRPTTISHGHQPMTQPTAAPEAEDGPPRDAA